MRKFAILSFIFPMFSLSLFAGGPKSDDVSADKEVVATLPSNEETQPGDDAEQAINDPEDSADPSADPTNEAEGSDVCVTPRS